MYDRGQRSFPLFNVACVGRKDGRSDGLYYKMQILARFSKAAKDYIMYHSHGFNLHYGNTGCGVFKPGV